MSPPGRSLTHGGLRRFRQGPGGVFFFLLRPRRVFLDNNKKCLGYYIGSKKTRRGHSKKKHHFLHNQDPQRGSLKGFPKRAPHKGSLCSSVQGLGFRVYRFRDSKNPMNLGVCLDHLKDPHITSSRRPKS